MAVENRLTADQLAALAPGDPVVIESAAGFGKPRYATGTVVRIAGPDILVKVSTRHGVTHTEQFRRRDGIRVGGVTRAELIAPGGREPAVREAYRRFHRVDTAYREWSRNRADVDRLRHLRDVIGDCLQDDD